MNQVDNALAALRTKRSELFYRSDFVIPAIVTAMVAELKAMDTAPLAYDVQGVLDEYYKQLSDADSPDRPTSLFNVRKTLEADLQKQENKIAQAITQKPDTVLNETTYPWYSHTKVHTEQRMHEWNLQTTEAGRPRNHTIREPYTENVPDHTRTLTWVVNKVPLDDENAAGLYYLNAVVAISEIQGEKAGAEPHTSSDEEYETSQHQKEKKTVDDLLANYKRIVDAIKSVRQLQGIASAGRSLILKWNLSDAQKLTTRVKANDLDIQKQLNEIDRKKREAQSQAGTEAMKAARDNFDKTAAEGRKQVEDAMDRARKDQWRSEFASYVTLLSQSYNVYKLSAPYFEPSGAPKNQNDKSGSKAAVGGQSATTRSTAPSPDGSTKGKRVSAAQVKQNNAVNGAAKFSLAENPEHLESHLQDMLDDVAKHPASSWGKLPATELTQQEVELMEVEQTLRVLPETEGDKLETKTGEQITSAAGSVVQGLVTEGVAGGIKEAAKEGLGSVHLADEGPLGTPSRHRLEVQTNKLMQEFLDARLGKYVSAPIAPDKCSSAEACLRSNNKPFTP